MLDVPHAMLRRLLSTAFLFCLLGGVVYAFTEGARERWRKFVIAQLEERGVHLEFTRFGLHLIDGLVAREVRLFNDESHHQLIMSIDRLHLDIDWGKLIENKIYIEGIDLANTSVKLPLDNDHPELGNVELTGMSAHVFLLDDRLEITKAEGELAGVLKLGVTGSIIMSKKKRGTSNHDPEPSPAPNLASLKRFDFIREKSQQVKTSLDWLHRFTYGRSPRLDLHLDGDAAHLQNLDATLHFSAGGVKHESYECQELSADATYSAGFLDLKRLVLKDAIGTFEASAGWATASDAIDFQLTTTADLPSLAKSIFDSDALREVVLYASSPPLLTLNGTWFVRGENAKAGHPVAATGRVQCGRFGTHGGIFEGAAASFGVSPQGNYVRDAMLRHRSGSVTLQAMLHEDQGFKYRAVLKMDPNALLPFFPAPATRELIKRFEVSENTTIFGEVEGAGLSADIGRCQNVGRFECHNIGYRGTHFVAASADISFSRSSTRLTNVQLTRPDGKAEAKEVHIDSEARLVTLDGVHGRLDPGPVTSCFARVTAEGLMKYHFTSKTEVDLDGMIGFKDGPASDFTVRFRSPEGTATYPLWGRDYLITAPVGSIKIEGHTLSYDVRGSVFDGGMKAVGSVLLGSTSGADYDVDFQAEHFPYPVIGKDLPFQKVVARVRAKGGEIPFDVKANVLGGACKFTGTVDARRTPSPYAGELRLEAVSFKRFAQVYSPSNESEGDLTGHFKFTGRMDDWKQLRGDGVLIILNGNLYAVPVLGPLTPLLSLILPKPIAGYNEANEADCTFRVADGVIATDDFVALTSAFKLVANGTIDFIHNNIDFYAQARARGLPGIVLFPVSELFEYRGEGSIGKPEWRPRFFSLGNGKKGNETPAMAAESTAVTTATAASEKAKPTPANEPTPPAETGKVKAKDRPLVSPFTRPGR